MDWVRRSADFANVSFTFLRKLDLLPLGERPVMIVDRAGSEDLLVAIGDRPATVIPVRGECYVLPPAVLAGLLAEIVRRFLIRPARALYLCIVGRPVPPVERKGYLDICIERLNPKVVMTLIDNMYAFHDLAMRHPSVLFIAVQNGYRLPEEIPKLEEPSPAWVLVMSEHDRGHHLVKGFNPERTITAGSLRQNLALRKTGQSMVPRVDLCIVSQWREGMFCDPMPFPRFSNAQNFFHKFASRYARERGLSLVVAGTFGLPEELRYYQQFYGDNVRVYFRSRGVNVYQVMPSASLVLTVNSTAGREALAAGQRVLFCDYPSELQTFHDVPKLMPLIVIDPDYDAFCRRVDAIRAMPDEEWRPFCAQFSCFMHPPGRPDICDRIADMIRQRVDF